MGCHVRRDPLSNLAQVMKHLSLVAAYVRTGKADQAEALLKDNVQLSVAEPPGNIAWSGSRGTDR